MLRLHLRGMTRRIVLTYLAIDLMFGAVVGLGFSYVMAPKNGAERMGLAVELAIATACSLTPFLVSLALLLRPVERWIADDAAGRATPMQIAGVGRRLRRIPLQFTILHAVRWPAVYLIVSVIHGSVPSQAALWLFAATFVFGPPPVGHSLALWLTTPAVRRFSLATHAAGIPDVARAQTMRTRLAFYCVCLCMAPAFYMSSIAVVVHMTVLDRAELAIMVASCLTTIGLFAAVCAALLATMITTPIRAMAEVVRGIARTGYVGDAQRIPTLRHDELGGLTELTNHMIEVLGRTELARREASGALAELNQTLELRVVERTSSLVDANRALAAEMRMRTAMEIDLRHAQKLEAVGRLAAGIAHEINTPIQFIGDSIRFAREGLDDLEGVFLGYRAMSQSILDGAPSATLAATTAARADEVDVPYLLEQMPLALERALDGIDRVAGIVRSVKQFAYPDRAEMAVADINLAVTSTIAVAVSEYKDVADVWTELGELPPVVCHIGEINQVVLNLIVNAAHAIGDLVRGTPARGRITVRTSRDADHVVIEVADTGPGIPETVRAHIFDVFFTTKEVGRGTGQGLAIARAVVVDKHGGQLTFDSALGAGTRFYIRIPIAGRVAAAAA